MFPLLYLALLASLQVEFPATINANELRTRTDTAWLIRAAAKTLPRDRIVAVAGASPESRRDLLDVAVALGMTLDSIDFQSAPPPCPNDSVATGVRGYRISRVLLDRDSRNYPNAGRPQWFHYVVTLEGSCMLRGERRHVSSAVRFDAVSDPIASFVWAVGQVAQIHDPAPPSPLHVVEQSQRRTYPILGLGALAFPLLGFASAFIDRRRLWIAFGVWSLLGLAVAKADSAGLFLGLWALVFELPLIAYMATAFRKAPTVLPNTAGQLRFGWATVALVVTWIVCLPLFWIVLLNSVHW